MTLISTALNIPFVDLAAQHQTIKQEIEQAISRVLHNTDFILGQDVTLFEQEFALFCEANHAVGVDSGTSALELALRAYDIGPGDEVITAANTFIATVLAITSVGATPVLVDIDPETYGVDPALIEAAITRQTKAIIPVHLYGHPADMDPILDIAMRHGLIVIEDASQAHGARYKGQRVGSLGHAAAFSFYPAKNLGAYGDGGMLVTNDPQIAEAVRMMRNYGQSQKYYHVVEGYNRRLDTLQAAVLRAKLPYMNRWNQARRQRAQLYDRMLAGSRAIHLTEAGYAEAVCHLYVVRVEHRDALQAFLGEKGIATGIHYPTPIHLQPVYQHLGYVSGDFPITEQYAKQILSLPMYPELSLSAIEVVAQTIKSFTPLPPTNPIATRSKSLG
ncbi:MAG: DegT/DnrJ/EryC1/StrS family aminotransferase [Anaerolineae bacterium]|nr:DegT/DnrJ/EryC1/StrS family aminotransferase [Anaerolineae bacterium]